MRRRARKVIVAAGIAYAALLLGFLLLRSTPLRDAWWLRLPADFLPFLSLPSLALLPAVLLWARSRATKALVFLPCLIIVLLYGPLFLPQPLVASSSSGMEISVMSYNVTRGDPGIDAILRIIESESADIVALQEVTPEVAHALGDLSVRYPYTALHPTPDGYDGCAVLSRFPITEEEAFPLVEGAHLYQRLALDVDGQRVHLLNLHLQPPALTVLRAGSRFPIPVGYDSTSQDQELERLLEELDDLEGRVIVVGDLNMTDQSPGYREVTRRLTDAYRRAGWGLGHTFPDREVRSIPTPFPLIRIDYIFHSRDMSTGRAYVGDRGGPNHRFLVAELSL
jgi:vancomycin resistance protein VanJ